MMDLDSAIQHCEEVAEEQEKLYRLCPASESGLYHCDGSKDCITLKNGKNKGCQKCASEHRQLAEWLKELKAYREFKGGQRMTIGEEVLIHGYIDEIRKDIVIIRNEGGYFGTVPEEIRSSSEIPNTCGDAISRQSAIDALTKTSGIRGDALKALYDAPSVSPQQKMGHWIIIDDCEQFIAKCSECGRIEDSRMISKYLYCHCGAKMEVEE